MSLRLAILNLVYWTLFPFLSSCGFIYLAIQRNAFVSAQARDTYIFIGILLLVWASICARFLFLFIWAVSGGSLKKARLKIPCSKIIQIDANYLTDGYVSFYFDKIGVDLLQGDIFFCKVDGQDLAHLRLEMPKSLSGNAPLFSKEKKWPRSTGTRPYPIWVGSNAILS